MCHTCERSLLDDLTIGSLKERVGELWACNSYKQEQSQCKCSIISLPSESALNYLCTQQGLLAKIP